MQGTTPDFWFTHAATVLTWEYLQKIRPAVRVVFVWSATGAVPTARSEIVARLSPGPGGLPHLLHIRNYRHV